MLTAVLALARRFGRNLLHTLGQHLAAATRPARQTLLVDTLADLPRSKSQLIAENALLRQQLLILRRSVKRPRCTPADRALLVLLASRVPFWRQALLLVQPETLLRWHRDAFRLVWRGRSRPRTRIARPKIAGETIALIKEMAVANPLWGAERLRGELLKLDIRVAKTTIQRHMRQARPPHHRGQSWATFLRNHAADLWATDFLPVTDVLFRPLYAYFVIELASRRVVHVGVTRHPSDEWVAQQLREATPEGHQPHHLICDHDSKYGPAFARVAAASSIDLVRTAYRAPRMNAICERFLGSVRRECLDHMLIVGERHLARVLTEYVGYFNVERPHQGIEQRVPDDVRRPGTLSRGSGAVQARPVLGGLHHAYGRAA
jgi:transposase InsO family protein